MHDILRDSPVFQAIFDEGLNEGEVKVFQQWLLSIVSSRFPQLTPLATEYVAQTNIPDAMQQTIFKLNAAQNSAEAEQILRVAKQHNKDS